MKTINELLTDMYTVVKASPINALSGEVYKNNARTPQSELEDCVIRILHGVTGKHTQTHALTISLFYKAHVAGNVITEDSARGQVLHKLLLDICVPLQSLQGYYFALDSREIYSEQVGDFPQYYVILRINFSTKN
jgi:hypothetical protein